MSRYLKTFYVTLHSELSYRKVLIMPNYSFNDLQKIIYFKNLPSTAQQANKSEMFLITNEVINVSHITNEGIMYCHFCISIES